MEQSCCRQPYAVNRGDVVVFVISAGEEASARIVPSRLTLTPKLGVRPRRKLFVIIGPPAGCGNKTESGRDDTGIE